MLDDLKAIHHRDGSDALGVTEKQWQQYQHNFGFSWQPDRDINNVVVVGMGGSGLAARAFKTWPSLAVPYEIVQSYQLPKYVESHTLVVLSSYSGDTTEVCTVLEQLIKNEKSTDYIMPLIAVITSGGALLRLAKEHDLPVLLLPPGLTPRMTFGMQLRALCELLTQATLIENITPQFHGAAVWLHDQTTQWIPTVPTTTNFAKQLALEAVGKSLVISSGPSLAAVAYKWKINFNENAKNIAWASQVPETDHNELIGWVGHPTEKPYALFELRSSIDDPRIEQRFDLADKLLSGRRPAPEIINVQGETPLKQLMWAVALGDFVSLYTAILNGVDPTPVDLISKFKKGIT
ncbi:MAG: bifunctional phosphoglucose/phosphomannose isomerase [Candidatus Saccharimonadales bacterium]